MGRAARFAYKIELYRHIVGEKVLDPLSVFFQEVLEEVPKVFEELDTLQVIQISPGRRGE
jgi:hypothetical protein